MKIRLKKARVPFINVINYFRYNFSVTKKLKFSVKFFEINLLFKIDYVAFRLSLIANKNRPSTHEVIESSEKYF